MGMETWVELSNYGETIRGMLHRPVGAGPHPAVLFLHGLGGNRIEANRLFVRAARILAKQGIAALRIDFRGAGESDGEAEARSVSGHLSDALTAYHFLAEDAQLDRHRLAVLGFSLGGAVAALLAGELAGSDLPEPAALVLWAAVADLKALVLPWLSPELRAQLEAGEPVPWGAELLGPAYYHDVLHLEPVEAFRRYGGPVLVVHGEADETVPPAQAQAWGRAREGVELALLPGAGHTFDSLAASRELLERTASWLVRQLTPTTG